MIHLTLNDLKFANSYNFRRFSLSSSPFYELLFNKVLLKCARHKDGLHFHWRKVLQFCQTKPRKREKKKYSHSLSLLVLCITFHYKLCQYCCLQITVYFLTLNVTLSLRFDTKFYNKNKFVWERRFEKLKLPSIFCRGKIYNDVTNNSYIKTGET